MLGGTRRESRFRRFDDSLRPRPVDARGQVGGPAFTGGNFLGQAVVRSPWMAHMMGALAQVGAGKERLRC